MALTDRELLELAAKAADVNLYWTKDGQKLFARSGGNQTPWNPLEHDGDALRLAVRLKMNINIGSEGVFVSRYEDEPVIAQKNNDDPYAATRRAIVRAAAEIGKGMK